MSSEEGAIQSLITPHFSLLITHYFFNKKSIRTMKKYIQPETEVKVSNLEMFMQNASLPKGEEPIDNSNQILTKEREGFEYEW